MRFWKHLFRLKRKISPELSVLNCVHISREKLLHNFWVLQEMAAGQAVFPVLKSNAYGHGLREVAKILTTCKPELIAVDSVYEALQVLEEFPQGQVLVMGYTLPHNLSRIHFSKIIPTIHSVEALDILGKKKSHIRVHIELDTGMARQGFNREDLEVFLRKCAHYPHIQIQGVFTHFSHAEDPVIGKEKVGHQIALFSEMLDMISAMGYTPKWIHASNSPGLSRKAHLIEPRLNAIRSGLGLYGVTPLDAADEDAGVYTELRPVLSWTSTLVEKRFLQKGQSVSYGGLFVAPEDMWVGTIPVGYYEGIPRSATGKWNVSFGGKILPIIGRVCMNLCMIDLRDAEHIKIGDHVTILGDAPGVGIFDFARACGTIPYEALTGISESIRRKIEK